MGHTLDIVGQTGIAFLYRLWGTEWPPIISHRSLKIRVLGLLYIMSVFSAEVKTSKHRCMAYDKTYGKLHRRVLIQLGSNTLHRLNSANALSHERMSVLFY